jgi:hypothetical protein
MTEASIPESAAQQRIDARPWQDPFAAIEKSFDKTDKLNPDQQCLKTLTSRPHPAWDKRPSAVPSQVVPAGPPLSADDQAGPSWKRGGGIAQPQQTIVPYEWFEQVSRRIRGDQKQILILWLNEEIFRGKPLRKLSGLKRFLYAARTTSAENKFKLIGPYSSATLRDMVSETRKFIYAPPYDQSFGELRENDAWPDLKDVQFYAYGAMADDQLLGDLAGANGTVQRFFESSGLHLQRTISTERAVARGIVSELRRRKVGLGSTGGDIVLISEWDTYYGQSLLEELAFGHTRPGDDRQRRDGRKSDWIHKLTYLRGSMVCFPKMRSAKIRRPLPILSKSRVMKRGSTGLWGKASMIICEG